jgi:transcriptional regulator of PTS gene
MRGEGTFMDARETGTSIVFSTIRQSSPVPRIDIVKDTGLSPATVTSITAGLIARGLIQEVPAEPVPTMAKRGRPRVNLKIRGDAHTVVGMKLSDKSATVTILDFDGQRISDFSNPSDTPTRTSRQAVEFLRQTLTMALENAGLCLSDISGMGIGIPGVIDAPAGHVYWSPTLTQRNVDLQQLLRDTFGIPVFVDNDANLVAIAEQRFGLGKKARNFIVISVELGVGMGIVIDGKLYRGTHGCGAELGHTKVHLDGALCRCGQRGCLEAYVGDYALLREASTAMDLGPAASTEHQMEVLLNAARSGNALASSITRRAGRMFAMGLANVVNIFSPELIILSGERMQYDYLYDDQVINDMKKSIVQVGGPPPLVRVHKWGDQMWAMGAAAYAIDGVTDIALRETLPNGT